MKNYLKQEILSYLNTRNDPEYRVLMIKAHVRDLCDLPDLDEKPHSARDSDRKTWGEILIITKKQKRSGSAHEP